MDRLHLYGCQEGARVVVAMSGGVDSSVAAALCHAAGYEVIGVTMQLYDGAKGSRPSKSKTCCGTKDVDDARAVALKLGIGHYVLDYETRFKEGVIDDFAHSYLRGETPLPCVRCNQEVKFADLLQFAKDVGAQALVSGHYVQRVANGSHIELHRAIDTTKDQSYFLFATTSAQLDFCHFPLGGVSKAETRSLAASFGLGVSSKQESQDICFVPDGDYARFIKDYLGSEVEKEGDILNEQGEIVGRHKGILHYTVGQRRGLGLGDVTETEPLYVLGIHQEQNQIVVGPRSSLAEKIISLRDINLLCELQENTLHKGSIKIRSTMQPVGCTYKRLNGHIHVELDAPQFGVAKGQAGVLYDGSRVLGGGFIV